MNQDVIYVSGGNTRSMLAVWREWGLPELLKEAWQSGVILAGISAGAICWFEQGLSDSVAGKFTVIDCLGFLEGSCSPHYDGETERRSSLHELLLKREILPGYAIDDGVAIHFIGLEARRAVSSRPNAKAYRVFETNGSIEEEPIVVEYIADEKSG
jgi:peptidase E